jgi:hypothetical protein
MEKDCSLPDVSEFNFVRILDFERVSRTHIAHKRQKSQSWATARLPNHILDLSGLSNKKRGRLVFRMDTPPADLEGKRSLMADLLVQIGDCQKQLK